MSVRVMSLVWSMDLPDSEKIVLLALADCANDEGHCWPSVASLVRKCSKSDRTIQGSIKRLVDGGHLTRREVPGKGCNYTVHPRSHIAPEAAAPPKGTTGTPEAASDKPSRTINTEAKASSERVIEAWKAMAKKHPKVATVRLLDNSRRQMLYARLKDTGEALLLEAIAKFDANPWLTGAGRDSKWRPSIDFILQPSTLRKLLEGTYGEDEEQAPVSPERRRKVELDTAALYERMGRTEEAAELRRRWDEDAPPRLVGAVVSKIMEGAREAVSR